MRFFEHQQQARQLSRRLVLLFTLAVVGVVGALNGVVSLAAPFLVGTATRGQLHGWTTVITLALIAGGSWWQLRRLKAGGEAVAEMIGGRPLDPATREPLERRLLNVVEEMALASGVPVPRVYVLDDERMINAFAAGFTLNDAVIGVTRGALTRLNRDELQGVIAHEFSHILNGDMALNLRLIGVTFGLYTVSLSGRMLMELGWRSEDLRGMALGTLVGMPLRLIGWIGAFFGRLIKAGISRQREFLADASAVQFTRNPDGIGGALRKVGGLFDGKGLGSYILHPHAETLSHLFLGAARLNFAAGYYATHPPLAERLKRIYGRTVEMLPAPEIVVPAQPARPALAPLDYGPAGAAAALSPVAGLVSAAAPAGADVAALVGTTSAAAQPALAGLAAQLGTTALATAVHDGLQAPLLVLAMVVDKRSDVGTSQRAAIAEALGTDAVAQVDALHAAVAQLPPGARLPLLDRAMPALRKAPAVEAERLLRLTHTLILADGRVTLPEFLLYTVLRRRLGPAARQPHTVRYARLAQLPHEAMLVLSLLAHARKPERPEHAFNAGVLLLKEVELTLAPMAALALDEVARALDRLNELAPLAKPAFIKACAAAAFVDGETTWQAASCLRTVCAALDAPLPPQIGDDAAAMPVPAAA